MAVKGPYVIDNKVIDIKANPPPEKPDLEIAKSRIEKETIE
tara:strand:+ start:161 stop:283 length:123 start_codon:yes stop_codon:yes gene_type:complete